LGPIELGIDPDRRAIEQPGDASRQLGSTVGRDGLDEAAHRQPIDACPGDLGLELAIGARRQLGG
jgi:hypothetical protein